MYCLLKTWVCFVIFALCCHFALLVLSVFPDLRRAVVPLSMPRYSMLPGIPTPSRVELFPWFPFFSPSGNDKSGLVSSDLTVWKTSFVCRTSFSFWFARCSLTSSTKTQILILARTSKTVVPKPPVLTIPEDNTDHIEFGRMAVTLDLTSFSMPKHVPRTCTMLHDTEHLSLPLQSSITCPASSLHLRFGWLPSFGALQLLSPLSLRSIFLFIFIIRESGIWTSMSRPCFCILFQSSCAWPHFLTEVQFLPSLQTTFLFASQVYHLAVLVNWSFGSASWQKKGGPEEKVSVLLEPLKQSKHLLYLRAIQGHWSYVTKTTYCHHTTSLNTSTTQGNAHNEYSIIHSNLIPKKSKKKKTIRCFAQPSTRCPPINIRKKFNTF